MSKSIVVLDTPCTCRDCMFIRGANYVPADEPRTCKRLYNCVLEPEHYNEDGERCTHFLNDYILEERKPEWCPLVKLPGKKGKTKTLSEEYNNEKNLIAKGYNLCISHILGEELPNF